MKKQGARGSTRTTKVDRIVREHMARLGQKGGAAAVGDKKRRGGRAHYRALILKRWNKHKRGRR